MDPRGKEELSLLLSSIGDGAICHVPFLSGEPSRGRIEASRLQSYRLMEVTYGRKANRDREVLLLLYCHPDLSFAIAVCCFRRIAAGPEVITPG